MTACSLGFNTKFANPVQGSTPHQVHRVQWCGPESACRSSIEGFIRSIYFNRYGASPRTFSEQLAGHMSDEGKWICAVGVNDLQNRQAYLEAYLAEPIEKVVSEKSGTQVLRSEIVEVGNLAAHTAGDARRMILWTTRELYKMGYRWVVFTATQSLINSFHRLGLQPIEIAQADPLCLENADSIWGSYYEQRPVVMMGRIEEGIRATR